MVIVRFSYIMPMADMTLDVAIYMETDFVDMQGVPINFQIPQQRSILKRLGPL